MGRSVVLASNHSGFGRELNRTVRRDLAHKATGGIVRRGGLDPRLMAQTPPGFFVSPNCLHIHSCRMHLHNPGTSWAWRTPPSHPGSSPNEKGPWMHPGALCVSNCRLIVISCCGGESSRAYRPSPSPRGLASSAQELARSLPGTHPPCRKEQGCPSRSR